VVVGGASELLVECFWPGVREADLLDLDQRAAASVEELVAQGEVVSYLGALLMREDEVVICRFQGSEAAVRQAAAKAAISFARIVEGTRSPGSGKPAT
jgi:hypothetical protein